MHCSNTTPLLDVAFFEAKSSVSNAPEAVLENVRKLLNDFILNKVNYDYCKAAVYSLIGTTTSVDRINEVLSVPEEPLHEFGEINCSENQRKRAHAWNHKEDNRLLYGITKFGLSDWAKISKFVGNGRSRSQCSQRWHRTLNPRISKTCWSAEDDQRLLTYVETYGTHSWTKVAQALGCRTDVQCRYRYQLITRRNSEVVEKQENQQQQMTAPQQPLIMNQPQFMMAPQMVPQQMIPQPMFSVVATNIVPQEQNTVPNDQYMSLFSTHGSCYKPQEEQRPTQIFSEFSDLPGEGNINESSNQVKGSVDTDEIWKTLIDTFDNDGISNDAFSMMF